MSLTRPTGYRRQSLTKPAPAPGVSDKPSPEAAEIALAIEEPPAIEVAMPLPGESSDDPAFREMVAKADSHRDKGEWRKAEEAYWAALAIDPRQPGYWVQHGHMCKEQGRFTEAEISYRSGAALGAEAADVIEHLRFVMARQGTSEGRFPIRIAQPGKAPDQVPTQADIRLLARLLWRVGAPSNEDILKLMRENATCDEAFAAMVGDVRFGQANINWLTLVEDGELQP